MAIGDDRDLQTDGGSMQEVGGEGNRDSVYAPPQGELQEEPGRRNESFKIYAPSGIALAAFLGGPLGATYLYATNYSRAGKTLARNLAVVVGLLFSLVFGLMVARAQGSSALSAPLFLTFIAYGLANGQNRGIKKEFRFQFTYESDWKAAGVALVSFVVTVLAAAAIGFFVGASTPVN